MGDNLKVTSLVRASSAPDLHLDRKINFAEVFELEKKEASLYSLANNIETASEAVAAKELAKSGRRTKTSNKIATTAKNLLNLVTGRKSLEDLKAIFVTRYTDYKASAANVSGYKAMTPENFFTKNFKGIPIIPVVMGVLALAGLIQSSVNTQGKSEA